MRYAYSVIRFVPDPVRGEFINVGLIVGSDESSEWTFRAVENLRRARTIDAKGILPMVWTFVDDIGRQLDGYEEALENGQPAPTPISEQWLERLSKTSNNVVQLTEPAPIVADTADNALQMLFEQFVFEPEVRRQSFRNKHGALAAIRQAYRASGLVKGVDYDEVALVKGGHHRERFDFVVANGAVVQMAQAWSFQIPAQQELIEKVKAWCWTVDDIRKRGGEAEIREHKVDVPKDVEVAAVYVAPTPDGSSHALNEALYAFRDVQVSAIRAEAVGDLGRMARAAFKRSR